MQAGSYIPALLLHKQDPRKKTSSQLHHEPSIEDILFHDEGTGLSVAAHPGLKRVRASMYVIANVQSV